MKNRIITYGTFDLLHYGHILLLQRAKNLCKELYVGVSSDEFNQEKGKKSNFNYEKRVGLLKELKSVDFIFPENNWQQKAEDIKKYNIDAILMGSDWQGKFDDLKKHCEVIYLPRTKGVSSTILKNIQQNNS